MLETFFEQLGAFQKKEQVIEYSNNTEQRQRAAATSTEDAQFKGLKWIFSLKVFSLSG